MDALSERTTPLEALLPALHTEYTISVQSLNRTGILALLPEVEAWGVRGPDGRGYPIPTQEQVLDVVEQNSALVQEKARQGFTHLQLTPLAMPLPLLIDRVERAIRAHAAAGTIFESKAHPSDPDRPVDVNTDEPVWIWDPVREADQNGTLTYFPKSYDTNHRGMTKEAMINDPSICAIPGWSIALVEGLTMLPKKGEGKTIGGRKQLETDTSPKTFIEDILSTHPYQGETGRTPEDFFTEWLTKLDTTNQVSYEWQARSGLLLLGSYIPGTDVVPRGYWHRDYRQLYLRAADPRVEAPYFGAVSTVRLLSI